MIIGIGSDLCDIRRVEAVLERFGDRFKNRCFTQIEQTKAARSATPAWTFAKRFAAKEACSKALGTGMHRGVAWRDIGVVNLRSGQPTIDLTGKALLRLQSLTPAGQSAKIYLTMSDEHPYAHVFVVIEAIPIAQ